jgi:VanZ family protein
LTARALNADNAAPSLHELSRHGLPRHRYMSPVPTPRATNPAASSRALLPWWLLYVAFVVYGSLVPLDFQPRPWAQALSMFRHIDLLNIGEQGRADWVANGVLYLPVGFFTLALLGRERALASRAFALLPALAFSFALAIGVEFVQLFFPPRTVSLNDIYAECIGSGLGALLALRWAARFQSLLATLLGNSERLAAHLLKAYAIAYLAFSLFPYDFLLSASEIGGKLRSDHWGWLVAPASLQGPAVLALAKLVAEALAVVPLGIGLCQWRARRRCSVAQAAVAGAVLGVAIEIAQFFVVSGISQGLSVLTRAVGVAVGALLWRNHEPAQLARVAAPLRRYAVPLALAYGALLAAINGWFGGDWHGVDAATRALADVRFLPFYYHYYTTEQAALLSLVAVALLYAPVGVLAWAAWISPGLAGAFAALLAALMEASKLFVGGEHPDPTNALIAAVAAWAATTLLRRLVAVSSAGPRPRGDASVEAGAPAPRRRHRHPAQPLRIADDSALPTPVLAPTAAVVSGPPAEPAAARPTLRRPKSLGYATLALGAIGIGWMLADFPFHPLLLGAAYLAYAALLWTRPQYLLIAVPAALPLLDLAPWSGRFFFDAFDGLIVISLLVGYARVARVGRRRTRPDAVWGLVLLLLGLATAIATVRGLMPLPALDADAFARYGSAYNALRVAKPVVWALLLYGLIARLAAAHDVRRLFGCGIVAGTSGVVAVVLWERWAFPGLWNFADVYRVTGPFSQMHTGGADLETWLTLGLPFVLLLFADHRLRVRVFAAVLLLVASYSLMVTFARIAYVAYAIALLLTLIAMLRATARRVRFTVVAALVLLAVGGLALPIAGGGFARERLAQSGADLAVRKAHWVEALRIRDPGWATALFGMGGGRYPDTHYWRSSEAHAASYRLAHDAERTYLRLGSGSPVYIEQFVALRPHTRYAFSVDLRSASANTRVSMSLCEKWLLTSARCVSAPLTTPAAGVWQATRIELASDALGSGFPPRPTKLSIFGASAEIDVTALRLRAPDGRELLRNGDFRDGLDRWFFSVDNDNPWHIWSLPVALLFDQGWFGVLAFVLFVAVGLARAARAAWRGDAVAGALFAACVGFVVIGTLDSLIDSPRMLLLFMLLIGLGARRAPSGRDAARSGAARVARLERRAADHHGTVDTGAEAVA